MKRILIVLTLFFVVGCGGSGEKSHRSQSAQAPSPTCGLSGIVSFDSLSKPLTTNNFTIKESIYNYGLAKTSFANNISNNHLTDTHTKIIKFFPDYPEETISTFINSLGGRIIKKLNGLGNTYLIHFSNNQIDNRLIAQNKNVIYVEDNQQICKSNITTNTKPYYYGQWNYNIMNIKPAQNSQDLKSPIIVAVIDSGIATHPKLNGWLIQGKDILDDDDDPNDTDGHGTHVAGIITGFISTYMAVSGENLNIKIMPVRVMDNTGFGPYVAVAEGITWAVNHGARIINLSLSTIAYTPAESGSKVIKDAIELALSQGATIIAASGNQNGPVNFPANYSPVIAVGAINPDLTRASYSNYGRELFVVSPGGDYNPTYDQRSKGILSCYLNNSYKYMIGTSMAAPHITSLVALMYSKSTIIPDINDKNNSNLIKERIKNHVIDINNDSKDDAYGYGLPDVHAVLTNTEPKMKMVKVFVGKPDKSKLSPVKNVGASGDFTIYNLQPGNYLVWAFQDNNGNNEIDPGEKIGNSPITLTPNTLTTNISIVLN